jgi:RimJ/RimL family protein N-acetyltransferase
MPYQKTLAGERCYLSPCTHEDALKWAQWFNDLDVTLPLGDEAYRPLGEERASRAISEIGDRQEPIFTIVDLGSDCAIGRGMLFSVDAVNRSCMLGIAIGEKDYWGKGYGQEAVVLLLDYAFNLLNLHSVMLGVFAFNERAITCYRKVGFREIGRRREARFVGGKAHGAILMDMLEDEFRASHSSRLR